MSVCTRRRFLVNAGCGLLGAAALGKTRILWAGAERWGTVAPAGPGAKYIPRVMAAAVRRQEEYGMLWPGQIYDGVEALENYSRLARTAAGELGIDFEMESRLIHSLEQAEAWVGRAAEKKADGIFLILLDRQQHACPTVGKAADSGIPTVVFAPVGTAFTTNTAGPAGRSGVYICSTDDFSQAVYGLKMLKARAKLREMRFIVLEGDKREDSRLEFFGTRLRRLPAKHFIELYEKTAPDEEIRQIAASFLQRATRLAGATEQDVLNGVRSFAVARRILESEEGDGITMDCLGALGPTGVSLPCISWARMNDCGVPAACEADLEACVTHALVQYLFDRPGFQQDPVPETAKNLLIGSHCSCPTRLNGFNQPPEPFYLSHHHGSRDAVPRTIWKVGQRVTVADVLLESPVPRMVISAGEVTDNIAVPPAGGCVVAVGLKLDGVSETLDYPGFHQLFFYGDFKRQLQDYCKLSGIQPLVV